MSEEIPVGQTVTYEIAQKAHTEFKKALNKGLIVKQPCRDCGTVVNVQGHHPDYDRPLDVIWLCREHHRQEHARIGRPLMSKKFIGPKLQNEQDGRTENMQALITPSEKRRLVMCARQQGRSLSQTLRVLILDAMKDWELNPRLKRRRLP